MVGDGHIDVYLYLHILYSYSIQRIQTTQQTALRVSLFPSTFTTQNSQEPEKNLTWPDHRSVAAEARAPSGARGCRSRPFWSPWPGSSWTSAPSSTWGAWDVATSRRRRRGECLQDINNDRKVGSYMMSLLFQVWLWITIWLSYIIIYWLSYIDYHIFSLMMIDDNLQILWLWFQIWAAGFGSFGNMGPGFPVPRWTSTRRKKCPLPQIGIFEKTHCWLHQNHDVLLSYPVLAGAMKRRHPKVYHAVGRNCGIECIEATKWVYMAKTSVILYFL